MSDRRQWLEAQLSADRATRPGSPVALVCARCVTELSVTGAGVTVLSHLADDDHGTHPSRGLVHATNSTSAALEDLQLTVGEGPCLDAFESGGPVLISDTATLASRWPIFAAAAARLGAAAVFSFPLQIGVARLGSLDAYRASPGPLTAAQLTDGLILADLATARIMEEIDGHPIADLSWLADPHLEVHQATGMVQMQLGVTAEVALMRLRGYAFSHDLAVTEVARLIVDRSLRLGGEPEPQR
ncbi:GAF domain-containing protein [Actinocatenispora thailandica]|uniref:GAF domain-containing protein n=1 Tax=Actinocatenispora thailandica TaxID=227318 RepID=A0A7R7DLW3_9ACTN|nr:GAF and ANTAR domain-containing protein [Actinocatenispora thailandica]BCJ34018.1 GAF domain-containing protein [Actinocatenispora thailandica]